MMQDAELAIARLREVRSLGVRVALDDFGTGWSSMSWLRELPVDELKIAKEFLGGPGASENDWDFVRAIVTLGHSLRVDVIAEGIECAEQLERLRHIGVDAGQGFLFSPPVTAANLPELFQAGSDLVTGGSKEPRRSAARSSSGSPIIPVPGTFQQKAGPIKTH